MLSILIWKGKNILPSNVKIYQTTISSQGGKNTSRDQEKMFLFVILYNRYIFRPKFFSRQGVAIPIGFPSQMTFGKLSIIFYFFLDWLYVWQRYLLRRYGVQKCQLLSHLSDGSCWPTLAGRSCSWKHVSNIFLQW